MRERRPSLQVLGRALAVLDLFAADQPEWTTTEIARATTLQLGRPLERLCRATLTDPAAPSADGSRPTEVEAAWR